MSTQTQAIVDQMQALSPDELDRVLTEASRLREQAREWHAQQARLREMQVRHAGRGLLNRLLDERAKERERG